MTSGCPEEETALQPNWKCLITRTPVSQVEWTCIHPRSSPQESRTCYTCGRAGHLARRCPQSKQESRGRPANPGRMKQVSTGKSDNRKSQSRQPEPEDFLHSSSDDDATSKVQLVDKGSVAQCVQVEIHGVPAYGYIDSGADITIMGGRLFKRVATVARLKKRDFRKSDKKPRTYDQRPFQLHGRIDLNLCFDGKTMKTPKDGRV